MAEIRDLAKKGRTFTEIAEALAKGGDMEGAGRMLERAKAVAAEMKREYLAADTVYEFIVGAEAGMGDIAGARATAAIIGSAGSRAEVYRRIAEAQANAGDLAGARATLVQMRGLERVFEFDKEGDRRGKFAQRLSSLVWAQLRVADFAGAKETAAQMPRGWQPPFSYRDIAIAQANAGDFAGAEATTDKITNTTALVGSYIGIAKAQAQAGRLVSARETLEKAYQVSLQTGEGHEWDHTAYYVYCDIAIAQAENGDIKGATATLTEMRNEWLKVSVYRGVALARANAGDTTVALEVLEEAKGAVGQIVDERKKHISYAELAEAAAQVAEAQAKAGDIAGAKATAAGIESESAKALAYRLIAAAQAKAGNVSAARETFKQAMAAVAKIDDSQVRTYACFHLALTQLELGDVAGAMESLAGGSDPSYKSFMLFKLAERLCGIGDPHRDHYERL